jgi:hypothetical protein
MTLSNNWVLQDFSSLNIWSDLNFLMLDVCLIVTNDILLLFFSVLNCKFGVQGDMPQEKRLKLGSPMVEARGKDKMLKSKEVVESGKPEESRLLDLSANDKIFNIGKDSRSENKPDALRTIRTGLQKEGSRVIFGIPKPGKKKLNQYYLLTRF